MTQNKFTKAFAFMLAVVSLVQLTACEKTKTGHLDPYLYYPQNPMTVPQGRQFESYAINPNGSTRPMHVELLHIYDKATGKNVDDVFMQKFPFQVWTAAYDHDNDTTLELVNAKRKMVDTPAIGLDPISGQLKANYNTINLPLGDYTFDVKISNVYGSRVYEKLGEFKLDSAPAYEKNPTLGTPYNKLYEVGNESHVESAADPEINIIRIADTPDVIIVKFVDKHGTPFNPSAGEIIKRPYPGNNPPRPYLQTMDDYAIKHEYTDTSMDFYYPVVPFPLTSLGNGYNYYYRIPSQDAHIDNFPDDMYSMNPRFVARFYLPGKYEVTISLPDVTHR